ELRRDACRLSGGRLARKTAHVEVLGDSGWVARLGEHARDDLAFDDLAAGRLPVDQVERLRERGRGLHLARACLVAGRSAERVEEVTRYAAVGNLHRAAAARNARETFGRLGGFADAVEQHLRPQPADFLVREVPLVPTVRLTAAGRKLVGPAPHDLADEGP